MKNKFVLLIFFVVVAMMLSACEIGITTKINADGSGIMGAAIKFKTTEATALASMESIAVDTLCTSLQSSDTTGVSAGMTFTQETHGDEIWCVASKSFATLAEMMQGEQSGIHTAEIKDGKFIFDADLDMGKDVDTSSLSMIKGSGYSMVMYYEMVTPGKIDTASAAGFDKINGDTARMTIIDTDNNVLPTGNSVHMHLESSLLLSAGSISSTTQFKKDGSSETAYTYKLTKAELDQLAASGISADAVCSMLQSQGSTSIPSGVTFESQQQGEDTWCVAKQSFTSLDALKGEIKGENLTINTMEINKGKFIFDATADTTRSDYVLTAPGKIDQKASNADKYEGNVATWSVKEGTRNIHLESSAKSGFEFKWYYGVIIACVCLLLIIIVGVVVFFVMRRKPKQPAM